MLELFFSSWLDWIKNEYMWIEFYKSTELSKKYNTIWSNGIIYLEKVNHISKSMGWVKW